VFVKIINLLKKKAILKKIHAFTMNLKERGITIGDLLIILIIILTSTILVKSFNKDKKTTFNHFEQEKFSFYKENYPKFF